MSCRKADLRKLQGGTGKHVDGDVARPLATRPFQALVQLTDATPEGTDGSLTVLPGFHACAARFFQMAGGGAPEGGFTPLTEYDDLCDEQLWVTARRLPRRWAEAHAALPACGAAQARGREGVLKGLRKLADELRNGTFGPSEPVRAGDYVLWDPRLPHTTGEPDSLSRSA